MQVNKVSSVYNTLSFGQRKASRRNDAPVYYVQNENVLKFGLLGLAIIGAAAVSTAILKKNNISPKDLIKKSVEGISKHMAANKQDPIIRVLDGKRDANAVRMYQKYTSQAKINSFAAKFLAGEFENKPQDVLSHMRNNIDKLNKVATRVI
jgi:hypothetical protein